MLSVTRSWLVLSGRMRAARPKALRVRLAGLYLLTVLSLAGLLYNVYGQRQRTLLTAGQTSPVTYTSPIDIRVTDQIATERERQAARLQIEPVFTTDLEIQRLIVSTVTSANLPTEVTDVVLDAYQSPKGVRAEDIPALIARAVLEAPTDRLGEARLVLERNLLPTSSPNLRLTEAARDAAAQAVPPAMRELQVGQVIVLEDEPLTEEHLRILEAVGLYSARSDAFKQTIWIIIGSLLLAGLFGLAILYASRHLETVSWLQLAFLVLLSLATLAVQRLAFLATEDFLFLALVPVLVAVLVSETAALLWSGWLALMAMLLAPAFPAATLLTVLVGGVSSVLLVRAVPTRLSLLVAATVGGLIAGLCQVLIGIITGASAPLPALTGAALVLAGGLVAGIGALGMVPVAESAFGFLTTFRLLELSNPASPLLQRLLLEAPGSYQHSLIISNLVEQAVQNIGGNALLARVGALYHDVGKIRRPQFFIENQFSGENPHNSLSPHLSYLIITSHVRDGCELLREYRLPRELEPFVAEHHGTTVLSYFYKRALEETPSLEELNFRYPSSKPQTTETAVLMLADAIESSSRTLVDPGTSTIRALIDRIIEQRLQDDQLSESPLNLRDLETIANTFERTLTAILHRRVRYPNVQEIRSLRRGGDPRRDVPVSVP